MYRAVFLNGPPLNFLSTKSLYECRHLEKFQASLHGILFLENLGGDQLKEPPCIWQWRGNISIKIYISPKTKCHSKSMSQKVKCHKRWNFTKSKCKKVKTKIILYIEFFYIKFYTRPYVTICLHYEMSDKTHKKITQLINWWNVTTIWWSQ